MNLSAATRESIRHRAGYACEYCGVSEVNTGGLLTIDHYQPIAKGGNDHLDNLLYCCSRCNLYKHDYFPDTPAAPSLWHPRQTAFSDHFLELEDGSLQARDSIGEFSILRLRLNRPPLIAWRLQKRQEDEWKRLLARYQELAELQALLSRQLASLAAEQNQLLEAQQKLLKLLLEQKR